MGTQGQNTVEQRRLRVIELVSRNEAVMAQYRASRASRERGEPAIPAAQVQAEAKARRRRA